MSAPASITAGTTAPRTLAQAARELGVLTVGVVTKPFQFEGSKRMRQAEEGVEALQKVVDTLIIIPNQNLFRLANEKTTFTEAFAMADDVLYQGVKGVTDLMVRPGLINLDFADVRAVMDEMGKAMMGTGEASGENRAQEAAERAIAYMGLKPGMRIKDIAVDTVFIGSCTNGRLEDLRVAASIMKGHHKADNIHRVLVVPASSRVRLQAEKEGLDKIFKDFGAEWRNAGCSMCLGMNPDKMVARERSISTSNRNFEGRQGKGSRTHLASPAVAAATAIRGTICSPADL